MKKLISLICVITLLATSIVTVTMPMAAGAADNFVSYDFEGYVGDDTLALSTLTKWKGSWGSYQLASGVAGPTSVQTDRGTSVNLITKSTDGSLNYSCIRPMLSSAVKTSFRFKASMMFKDLYRGRTIRISNKVQAFYVTSSSITMLGNKFSQAPKKDIWYDIDFHANFKTGYYVGSITAEGVTETFEGYDSSLLQFGPSGSVDTNFIELSYWGNATSPSSTYIDDVYVGESSGLYKSVLSESDFEGYVGNPDGTDVPEGFNASGVSAGVNGFYAESGAVKVKTANTTPITLEKPITVTGSNKVTFFGTIRAMADVNLADTNADRSFLVGEKEALKFASDGTVTAGSASAAYETGKAYRVSVKIDVASAKATAYVYDGDEEIVSGSIDITEADVTKVAYKTVQTGASSESIIDNFSFYNDNGFSMASSKPASGSKNIMPSDVTVAFSNPVASVGYVTLNGEDVDYTQISSNEIYVASASEMDYGKDYTIKLGAVKDIFGEEKDFTIDLSTIVAKSISNVSITDGETVTAKVTGVANDGGDYNYTIVLAQYNAENNMLLNIETTDFALEAESKDFTAKLPAVENAYYEAYLWDSFDSKNVISQKATLGTEPFTDAESGKDGFVEDMDTGVMTATNLGINPDGYSVILVLKPGKTPDDIMSAEKLTDVIDFIKQFDYKEADVFAYTPSAGNGFYSYILDGTLVENAFDYIDPAYVQEVYEEINKDGVSFVDCIAVYNKILVCDTTELADFTDDEAEAVDSIMLAIREDRDNGFDTIASFQDAFYAAVAQVLVANSDSPADVKTAFEKYGKYYGIDGLTAYKTYAEANDTAKAEIYAVIAAAGSEAKASLEAVDKIFGEPMILSAVRNSTKQVQLGNIINDNNDTYLHFDFSKYNKVTNKSALHKTLVGADVETIAEFEAAFNAAVDERLKAEEGEKDVSEGIASSGNFKSYDFEGWVGNDETLALSTLQSFYGTAYWASYQTAASTAGPTSVQTDRGTSLDVVQRDGAETNNNCVVRPYSQSPITTSAEIRVSVQFKEMNRASALYIYGKGSGQYNTLLQEGTSATLMGTKLSNKLAPDTWYDIVYRINKISGYYEVTISCADWSETVIGRNATLAGFPNFNYLGLGYIGKRTSGKETHIWYDDVSFREIDPLYIPMLDENAFDSFTGTSNGLTAPAGFEVSGAVSGKNGLYAQSGKVNLKTTQEGDLSLSKGYAFETGYNATVYGVLRTEIDITPKDKNADRKLMIGEAEVIRFGADGNISVGEAYKPYDANKEYKVIVKADSFTMQREGEDGETEKFNNYTVVVMQGEDVVLEAVGEIPLIKVDETNFNTNLTDVKVVVSQTGSKSETLVDNFNTYNDNGFYVSKSTPSASETGVLPCNPEISFSNTIVGIGSIIVNNEPVDFDIIDSNKIRLNIKDSLEYNKKYRIIITDAEDMFGEIKEFRLTFYTAMASKLSDIILTDGENVKASVSGFSYDGNKYNYVLILAKFDSATSKLLDMAKTPISLSDKVTGFEASLPKGEGTYFEGYVWDSAKGMVAIKDKAVLGENALTAKAESNGYVQNMDTDVVTATNTGAALSGGTVLVLKPGKNMNDVALASDLMDVVDYIAQFDSSESDVFAWTPGNGGGKYGVAINGAFKSNAFTYIDPNRVETVRLSLNADGASFASIVNANNDIFTLDLVEFKTFGPAELARFEELVGEQMAELEAGFDTIESFRKAFRYALARVLVENSDGYAGVKTAIEKYGDDLGVKDFVAYNDYSKLSEKGKNAIYDDISKNENLSDFDEFADAFAVASILRAVQYTESQTEISNIINDNNEYLKFDISGYNGLTKKHEVNAALVGNYYGSLEDLEEAFREAIEQQEDSDSGSGKDSGKGSGKGSGSGSGSLVTLGPVSDIASGNAAGFTDLAGYDWAKEAISALSAKGVISGRSKTIFDPAASITREEFTKLVINAFTSVDANIECSFTDVPKGAWYYSYVATANKLGIITGTSKATFGTGEKITRQDMATILYRVCEIFGIELEKGTLNFADAASVSDYAKDAVSGLATSKIINGKGNNCFAPFDFATRAEASKMIYETMERGDK